MDSVYSIDNIRNLAYRCKNREVVRLTTWDDQKNPFGAQWDYARVVQAHALFELHQVKEMAECLARLVVDPHASTEIKLYCTARQDYYRQRHDEALAGFRQILSQTSTSHFRFRALLGIANIHYSELRFHEIPGVIEQMQQYQGETHLDDQLSLLMLRANYLRAIGLYEEARETLHDVMKQSVNAGWNFFVIRSLYGLALIEKNNDSKDRMKATLEILQSFIDQDESVYLSYIINEQFKEDSFAIKLPVSFDAKNMRFTINGRTVALHEKPLLYRFLQLLSQESQFVSKEMIAKNLWVDEFYHPNVHDARIFDIAKRARGLIEKYDEQPVIL